MSALCSREGAGDDRGDAAQSTTHHKDEVQSTWSYAVSACTRLSTDCAVIVCLCTPHAVGMHVLRHIYHVVLLLLAGTVLLSSSVLGLGDGGQSVFTFVCVFSTTATKRLIAAK